MVKSVTLLLDTVQMDALYQQLMRGKFTVHDFDALTYAYDWSGVYPEVLGTVKAAACQSSEKCGKNATRRKKSRLGGHRGREKEVNKMLQNYHSINAWFCQV